MDKPETPEIKNCVKLAMRNRAAIEESQVCGCYYCCKNFSKLDIVEWTDKDLTAICPHCNVDAVLADVCGLPLDEENLKKMHDYWFTPRFKPA